MISKVSRATLNIKVNWVMLGSFSDLAASCSLGDKKVFTVEGLAVEVLYLSEDLVLILFVIVQVHIKVIQLVHLTVICLLGLRSLKLSLQLVVELRTALGGV